MLVERHFKNEDKIKDMIIDARKRGVCDKNGETLSKYSYDHCFVANAQFRDNYDEIDWNG